MPESPLPGGCMCGGVRFEIDEPLVVANYCHCSRCRRRSGAAASPQARIVPGSLRLVAGEELVREWRPPEGFVKAFCSQCGGQLWSYNPHNRDQQSVRLGAFDGDPGIRPSFRSHVGSAAVWEEIPDDGLPRYEARKPD